MVISTIKNGKRIITCPESACMKYSTQLSHWTKFDGFLTALISIWLNRMETENKEYAHIGDVKPRFSAKSQVYKFFGYLISKGYAEPYDRTVEATTNLIKPTSSGLTAFLNFYKERLKRLEKIMSPEEMKTDLDVLRLERTCKSLKKLQTLFFPSPRP